MNRKLGHGHCPLLSPRLAYILVPVIRLQVRKIKNINNYTKRRRQVAFLFPVQEDPALKSRHGGHPAIIRHFPESLYANAGLIPQIMSRPRFSTSFLIQRIKPSRREAHTHPTLFNA